MGFVLVVNVHTCTCNKIHNVNDKIQYIQKQIAYTRSLETMDHQYQYTVDV